MAVADRSAATRGNAGTYMSVASGAIAVRKITVATSADVSPAWRTAAAGTGLAGCGASRSPSGVYVTPDIGSSVVTVAAGP